MADVVAFFYVTQLHPLRYSSSLTCVPRESIFREAEKRSVS